MPDYDSVLARLIKTKHLNKPKLLPEIPNVVVSLFDGSGTIWQILDKTGLTPEYRFSAEADPYQIALLGARYGYRNPPTWLKDAAPEQNGYENPNGLIHLGSIMEGGLFEHEGELHTLQQMVDIHTGVENMPVTMLCGGPVCSSNSGLSNDDPSAEDATSNLAGDFYVDAAQSVRAVNPDIKMVVENIRNTNKNANNYNRKVMAAFGATAVDYYNNKMEEYEDENKVKRTREVSDVPNKLGLQYRLPQWHTIDTPESSPMSRIRSIWANYRLPEEEYDALVTDQRKGVRTMPVVNPFDDGWAPLRGGRLGTLTGNSGIDDNPKAALQSHIALMDSAGTILAKTDPNGAYILTQDGRPGLIKSRAKSIAKKIKDNSEVINDPTYGEILVWVGKPSAAQPNERRPTLPRTHLELGKPYTVRYPSIEEGKKLMWDDDTLADVPPEVDKYLIDHTKDLYPHFMRYNKKGQKKSQKHNKKAARHAQGISWHTPTFEKVILGILRSNQKIDPDIGMADGGYVEGPKKSQPRNELATRLKALGRFS